MAPSKRRKYKDSKKDESQNENASVSEEKALSFLDLEDVTCKICLNIMIKPVSLPCHHDLCYDCYENCVAKSNLSCPMCRKRISVWCRQATKNNAVVNEILWARIKAQFPEHVQSQNEGKDEKDVEDFFPTVPMHQFAEPGELLKEFEAEQERLQREEEERRLEEEKASADLIAQFEREQAEEWARLEEEQEKIRLADIALAKELSEVPIRNLRGSTVINTPISSRKRPRKTSSDAKTTPAAKKINQFFTSHSNWNEKDEPSCSGTSPSAFVPVTEHYKKRENSMSEPRSSSRGSLESIDQELTKRLHFRPINVAPLTPPKSSPGSSKIVKPQVVSGTAKNLTQLYGLEEDEESGLEDVNHNQPDTTKGRGVLAEELMEMEREWLRQQKAQEDADRELAQKLQEELDEDVRSRTVVNRRKGSKDEYELRASKSKNQSTIEDSFQRSVLKSNQLA